MVLIESFIFGLYYIFIGILNMIAIKYLNFSSNNLSFLPMSFLFFDESL